jgi:hypothetical protein
MNHAQRPSIIAVIVGVAVGALYFMWHLFAAAWAWREKEHTLTELSYKLPRLMSTISLVVLVASPALADNNRDVIAQMKADKAAFLRTVDESISGDQLVAHPQKFVGKHVDLHCKVSGVVPGVFSANCSTHKHGVANVTIEDDSPIKVGQAIRVLGVVRALPGFDNSRRTSMWFPAVKVRELRWDQ